MESGVPIIYYVATTVQGTKRGMDGLAVIKALQNLVQISKVLWSK